MSGGWSETPAAARAAVVAASAMPLYTTTMTVLASTPWEVEPPLSPDNGVWQGAAKVVGILILPVAGSQLTSTAGPVAPPPPPEGTAPPPPPVGAPPPTWDW